MVRTSFYKCKNMYEVSLSTKTKRGNGNLCGKYFSSCISFIIILLFHLPSIAQETTQLSKAGIHIIPYPQQVKLRGDDFTFEKNLTIVLDKNATEGDKFAAAELTKYLKEKLDIQTSIQSAPFAKSIILTRKNADRKLSDEGYSLTTEKDRVIVRAKTEAGLFYGVQTFLQLIQNNQTRAFIKGMEIISPIVTKNMEDMASTIALAIGKFNIR